MEQQVVEELPSNNLREQEQRELLPSQQEQTNALKILMTQLQKTELTSPSPQSSTTKKKKKKGTNGNGNPIPNPNIASAIDDRAAETNVASPSLQDLVNELQNENRTLRSNLVLLEEEVCRPFLFLPLTVALLADHQVKR
jgi:hypothetical protein